MFSDNSFSGTVRNLRVISNHFDQTQGVDLNAPSAGSITDISIVGNTVYNVPSPSYGFAIANGKYISITGNTLDTIQNEAVHIENGGQGITVTGNTMENVVSGVVVYAQSTYDISVLGNVIVGTLAANDPGIKIIYDGSAVQPTGVSVSNNTVENFANGITWGIQVDRCVGSSNLIRGCTVGMVFVQNGAGAQIDNNTFDNCGTCFSVSTSVSIGRVTICDGTTVMKTGTPGSLCVHGLNVYLGLVGIPAGVGNVTATPAACVAPTIFDGPCHITWGDGSTAQEGASLLTESYNGTMVTTTSRQKVSAGTAYASGLVVSGGNLSLQFTNTSTSAIPYVRAELSFDGDLVW